MRVALHIPPACSNEQLARSVQRAASLDFKAVQISPLSLTVPIESERLRRILETNHLEISVHIGGIWDARKFAFSEEECAKTRKQIHYGIELCTEISSKLVSFHPPLFAINDTVNEKLLLKAKTRFYSLVEKEAVYADRLHVRLALESFCYYPFIFEGLNDFECFVESFPSEKLGVLLDVGHIYQMRINIEEAVQVFKNRLLDVHVHDATLEEDYRKATHLPLRKGSINFPRFINVLREIGYSRWLTLEVKGDEKETVESKEYLENLINGLSKHQEN